jgi:uncharacterized oligopeptide transporter (OPT) family protein
MGGEFRTGGVPRQLTVRALAIGCAIGAALAAGNTYTGLKSGFIDGGALTAALLSFTFFATFKRLVRVPFGPLENNVAQTAASSAAIMAFVHGLMGPMPALTLMGHRQPPPWALWTWGLALSAIGIVVGTFLRRKLVVDEALPFPSGIATAELIRTAHADEGPARRRTWFLVVSLLIAAAATWFRDGRPSWLAPAIYLPMTVAGLDAAGLTLGIANSPLMAATGMFIGLRGALTLFGGGLIAWAAIAPMVARAHLVKDAGYAALAGWLVWPAVGMMLAGTVGPLILDGKSVGRALVRSVRDALNLTGRRTGHSPASGPPVAPSPLKGRLPAAVTIVVASAGLAWTGWTAFGLSPVSVLAAVALSILLAGVCARAAGETDLAPVGQFGMLSQILFARGGAASSILAGSVVSGNATETAQILWSFKAGYSLRASPRAQIAAQAVGALVGSLVVVPTYLLLVRTLPLGSERMPAVSAVSFKATADALTGGLSGLPPHALQAATISFGIGLILCALGRTRIARAVPSPVVLGIATLTPLSMSAAALIGAGAIAVARRRAARFGDGEANALAAGALAGESLAGVLVAALTSAGILRP